MPNYRRYYLPNAVIFITCVTEDRRPFLKAREHVELFFSTVSKVKEINPFGILASVVLPDQFHWLMNVEDDSGDFSKIMHSLKRNFTWNYKKLHNVNTSLEIWQRGFWDHVIRDERDLEKHFDYIHRNPVKHRFVSKPEDWLYSTYKNWVEKGSYGFVWGWNEEPENIHGLDFE